MENKNPYQPTDFELHLKGKHDPEQGPELYTKFAEKLALDPKVDSSTMDKIAQISPEVKKTIDNLWIEETAFIGGNE